MSTPIQSMRKISRAGLPRWWRSLRPYLCRFPPEPLGLCAARPERRIVPASC
jgi:hypothetical protein